ncbi:MAG TPA: prephenate dehydrogenase/arogenate dehydrogenase family protein [Candidatus Methylomirabilis sp.]|nr:prephenate dehydrogenase/arogenate dehydrogenase family protein [Candidatus Methylomirabilis sp.]
MTNSKFEIRNSKSAPPLFREMAIIGVGLIGGSLGLAARKAGLVESVVGVSRDPLNRQAALDRGLVDRATADLGEALRRADLAVLAVPVHAITALLPEVARRGNGGCLVTDVGSVKGSILLAGDAAFPDGRFVAGHPIAGREKSGPAAARADLFEQANWILTPSPRTRPEAADRVAALWRGVGATVVTMEAARHDEIFATVSHLPHLVAYALMDAVLGMEDGGERLRFSAGGLRDFTRVAGSDPIMWRDIFLMNRDPLLRVLHEYQAALAQLEHAIRTGDGEGLVARLSRARVAREEIAHRP